MIRHCRSPSTPERKPKRRRLGHLGHQPISNPITDDDDPPPHLVLLHTPCSRVLITLQMRRSPADMARHRTGQPLRQLGHTANHRAQSETLAPPGALPPSSQGGQEQGAHGLHASQPPDVQVESAQGIDITTPFSGSFRGCTWNSQALFARDINRHELKTNRILHLLGTHDVLALQETHSTEGKARSWTGDRGTTSFWSHNPTTRTAGVALLVRTSFLQQFLPLTEGSWQEILPGRAAVLRLDGPQGSLDLFTVYMHTGRQTAARTQVARALAAAMRPQSQVLSLMMGDWNFVMDTTDRFEGEEARWTGGQDAVEAATFASTFNQPHGFVELDQPEFTHESGRTQARGASRLDRIYSNHHLMDQLDHEWGCSALRWTKRLSHHRPVSFFRRAKSEDGETGKPLDAAVFRDPDWKHRTLMQFSALVSQETTRPSALRKLVLLKTAMVQVADRLKHHSPVQPVASHHDKLSATMTYIRVAERRHLVAMARVAQKFPLLHDILPHDQQDAWTPQAFMKLRDLAVDLNHKALIEDLNQYSADRADMEPGRAKVVKERLHARLRRMVPGNTGSLKAVQLPNGEITTDPATIAHALTDHWQKVFRRSELDPHLMDSWLHDSLPQEEQLPPMTEEEWKLTREDVAATVLGSGNTMAGPDRLPYEAWRQLGDIAVDVLFAAGQAMQQPDFSEQVREAYDLQPQQPHPFNLGTLVCLPKKAVAHHDELGDVFTPEGTRPLSIVDTANRLLANAFRRRWEPILARWISPEQQGFLPGRSLLSNVIDIEEAAVTAAMQGDKPATLLFDFSAAFPSVNQEFLLKALRHIGLPEAALSAVQALYDNNRCRLAFAGSLWASFDLQSGIRQGCPLSPLLFATVLDPFLRRLKRRLPGQTVRAYADDTAAVVHDITQAAPILEEEFSALATVANLVINTPKTICIPLWHTTMAQAGASLASAAPSWAGVKVASSGRYLGFQIGPGKGRQSWETAGEKMLARSRIWPWSSLGLFYATSAYNVYVASLPSFVAQLEEYPEEFTQIEHAVLRKAAPGPYQWAMPDDLHRLRDCYGQIANFRNLRHYALAAKIRVCVYENAQHGGLRIRERARDLQQIVQASEHIDRRGIWADWIQSTPVLVLRRALEVCRTQGLTPAYIQGLAAGSNATHPFNLATRKRVRKKFQTTLSDQIRSRESYNPHRRMEHKLGRWQITSPFPRIAAERALKRLSALDRVAPPRVGAAVLATMWNKWPTARRFQREGSCCLRCSPQAHDSIEHYACCPIIRSVASSLLRLELQPPPHAITNFLLITPPPSSDPTVTPPRRYLRMALLVTAAYNATNAARHKPPRNAQEVTDMLGQSLREAVRNHPVARAELHNVWNPQHGALPGLGPVGRRQRNRRPRPSPY